LSNWFQEHPITTIISHTVLVAASTWAVSYFVIDENKVNYYKAQVENERTVSEQYKAKVDTLEAEISKLRQENVRFLDWLEGEPKSFPALVKTIKILENQIKETKSGASVIDVLIPKKNYQNNYTASKTFLRGDSFTDPVTQATIGVSQIHPDFTADVYLYLPGKSQIENNNIKPGSSWNFTIEKKNYKITLDQVNWLNNSLKATVTEIENKDN